MADQPFQTGNKIKGKKEYNKINVSDCCVIFVYKVINNFQNAYTIFKFKVFSL